MSELQLTGLDSLIPSIGQAFAKEKLCRFKPLPFAAAAFLAIEMKRFFNRPVILITECAVMLEEMRRNLNAFAGETDSSLLDYPPLENYGGSDQIEIGPIVAGERLRTLMALRNINTPFLLNTCVQALMQKTVSPVWLEESSLRVAAGQECDPDKLTAWLGRTSYEFVSEVQERGQAVRRGGLTDVWPLSEPYPLRLEFNGSIIETIRVFSPVDQVSFARKSDLMLLPAKEMMLAPEGRDSFHSLVRHLPADAIYFWVEKCPLELERGTRAAAGIAYHAELYEKTPADAGASKHTISFRNLTETMLEKQSRQCFSVIECFLPVATPAMDLGFQSAHEQQFMLQSFLTPDIVHENRQRWLALLEKKAHDGMKVHFYFSTPGALDRFRGTVARNVFHLHLGTVSDGFLHEDLRLAVISEADLLMRAKIMRRHTEIRARRLAERRAMAGETIADPANIEPGDLVVHINHGIGKYLGLNEIVFNGKLQETLAIEYAGGAKLYVPVSQAHLLSRYMSPGGRKVQMHYLGTGRWSREKLAAQKAICDLAASLLETQALRETLGGFAFPPDAVWQHDFEAAFPYEETEDQEKAIREVKADMESVTPMDRLICGDAGYGKTEVAIRAAFKAVLAGKQVAVLVPTTVLALQHYEVFQQRMAAYPIRVELLCRFRSAAEQQHVVGALRAGAVDIVIGTHRLLQADLGFKDLGLIIIDEEQRFGVAHKEYLKRLKKLADVLTLTATPIPRTLYLSLTGARKISMIQSPPKARQPIETIVARDDDRLVREVVLRELNRGGQAYYLHNRIATIDRVFARLKVIVPEARVAVVHGQMSSRELADKMHAFAGGLFDVLLCTTIVESGVDLPNVNTILIDRADRFGIADLYQIRGRVGRSDRKGYAYLLTPVHDHLLDISRRRLRAIMEHSKLGSGFKLAMLDLEIRGAGNLLGPEQSGHIAAIGFDLYCQLLRRTIEDLKGGDKSGVKQSMPAETVDIEVNLDFIDLAAGNDELGSSAFLPPSYVEEEDMRFNVYRKIASAVSRKEIKLLRNEFRDRFGPIPVPFDRLLKIAVIRLMAAEKNISVVESRNGRIMFSCHGEYFQIDNQFPRLRSAGADGKLGEIVSWLGRVKPGAFVTRGSRCRVK